MTLLAGAETWWADEAGQVEEDARARWSKDLPPKQSGPYIKTPRVLDRGRRTLPAPWSSFAGLGLVEDWHGVEPSASSIYVGSSGCGRVSMAKDVRAVGRQPGRRAWVAGLVEAADKSVTASIGTEWRVPDSRASSRDVT